MEIIKQQSTYKVNKYSNWEWLLHETK